MRYIILILALFISTLSFSQGGKLIRIKVNKGETGSTGPAGSNGSNGTDGVDGDDGREIELQNTGTYIQWRYVGAGSWTNLIDIDDITGPTGATGATGSAGSNGSNGTNGTNGADGADGSTWYDGAGTPSSGLGINGDYYLNDSNGDVYLKSGGSWSIVANIKGTDGTGAGTVTDVTGSAPIVITGTSTVTPNVTLDTTSATGAGTQYDLSLKENKLTGTSGQTLRFSGTNTVAASSLLYNNGSSIGINNTSPSGSLTVNGSSYFNSQTPFSLYNASGTGIYTSFQDGANLDNLVYSGTRKTFTLGYTSGGGLGISDIANKKLHVNGGLSVGEGIYNTGIDQNSLIVEGSAIVQTRSGTATGLAAYDVNNKFANMSLGSGLSITSGTLNYTNSAIQSLGGQTGTTQTFAYGQSGASPSWSSSSNVHTFRLPTATIGQLLVHSGTDWIAATPAYLTTLNGITNVTQTFATGTSGTNFNISSSGTTHTFNFPNASGSNRGLLTSSDWTTFNGKENALTFNAPLTRSTNTISIPAATTTVSGHLTSTDWNTFDATNKVNPTGTSNQDWNTATLTGRMKHYFGNTNAPGGENFMYGYYTGHSSSSTEGVHLATSDANNTYTRVMSGGTWGPWKLILGTTATAYNLPRLSVDAKTLIQSTLSDNGSYLENTASFRINPTSAANSHIFFKANSTNLFLIGDEVGILGTNAGSMHTYVYGNNAWSVGTNGTKRLHIGGTGLVGIGNAAPARTLHVTGEVRITDLTTDTPTSWVGSDGDGDLSNGSVGNGIALSSGALGLTGQALAVHNLASNGLIARTSSGNVSARTITAGNGIAVTNGDGVSGNPTIVSESSQYGQLFGNGQYSISETGTYTLFSSYADASDDGSGSFTTNTGTGRITCNFTGTVKVSLTGYFINDTNDGGNTNLGLFKNANTGTFYSIIQCQNVVANTSYGQGFHGFILNVTSGDYFDTRYTNSITNQTVNQSLFLVQRIN